MDSRKTTSNHAVPKALIEKDDHESLKVLKFGKDWTQSFFRRMVFKKRAATTGKVIIPEDARKEAELIYLYDIVTKIESHNISHRHGTNLQVNLCK